ncbi:MAG: hypothetical protein ACR2QF_09340 [Geminicoccaceae bacterium]
MLSDRWIGELLSSVKNRAKKRGMSCELTPSDIASMWRQSRGYCTLTGIKLSEALPHHGRRRPWAPSIDRINSDKSYTRKNCRLICVAANYAMNEWGEKVLFELAEAIARQRGWLAVPDYQDGMVPTFKPLKKYRAARQDYRMGVAQKSAQNTRIDS